MRTTSGYGSGAGIGREWGRPRYNPNLNRFTYLAGQYEMTDRTLPG
jgi:hypothetical protein